MLADAPVSDTTPTAEGELHYTEGVFIGYRAWERAGTTPAYPFGHGLGYTEWSYETIEATGTEVRVRLTNSGPRAGREVVQIYLAPVTSADGAPTVERPARWLAGFASVEAAPGESVEARIPLPRRAFEIWDEESGSWTYVAGRYEIQAARSVADRRLSAVVDTEA